MESNHFPIEEWVRCYYAAVVRLACSILDDDCEAEDAAQETFIAAGEAFAEFRAQASPKTWLFAIAINICRSRLRRQKTRRVLVQALASFQAFFLQADSPEQSVERAERDQQVWAAVDRLPEKHRLVVILHYVHELPLAEIAQVLEISEGTVHSRLHYARQSLAGQLQRLTRAEETPVRSPAGGAQGGGAQ